MNKKKRIKYALSNHNLKDTIALAGLTKIFSSPNKNEKPKIAVDNVWYGVSKGEIFGFLGVNGAGKTTTLSMLTGNLFATSGTAYINNISIEHQTQVRQYIGYVSQYDALFDLLTAKEHLMFYGLIKNLSKEEINKQTDKYINELNLTKYTNRQSGTYSGGNKRKLSTANAMIGNPLIVLMDEPSTGMDPVSRKQLQSFISNLSIKYGRSVILTTHSMEECESISHRIGIMVNGQLSCLGTSQHLKSKFGKGYQLDIVFDKIDDNNDIINNYNNYLTNFEIHVKLMEQNRNKATFEIRSSNNLNQLSLSKMFEIIENSKEQYAILSYTLDQTTLEQIFLKMARNQAKEKEQN